MYWACMNINYIVFSYGTNYSNLSPGENWNFLFRKFVRNWSQIFYIYTEWNLNLSWRFSYTNFLGENCSFWPMNMHGCHNLWISDIHDMYIMVHMQTYWNQGRSYTGACQHESVIHSCYIWTAITMHIYRSSLSLQLHTYTIL